MKINITFAVISVALSALFFVSCGGRTGEDSAENQLAVSEQISDIGNGFPFDADSLISTSGKVKKGEYFSNLLLSLGMNAKDAYDLTQACADVFDVRSLRIGNAYTAYYGESLEYLVYERDRSSSVIFRCVPPYSAQVYEKPVTVQSRYADVTIRTSLWNDMLAQGVSPLLILSLSDIYAWTIDFFGLQKGDRFQVLYDERICDGEVLSVDTVRYAVFTHAGQTLPMIMFDQGDGGNMWWNEKGESMRKAFLKAPLKYSRVSSGFTYSRKHPVTRRVQPHTGVDYAAPTGTPVMTIGDGTVTSVKNEGAGGKTVRIRHNSVYSTAYLHLSRYASGIKAGKRVRQGEVIGYVGSSGRSTGPHLDFRVWKNGTPINPLKMDSPPAEPLKEENLEAFNARHMSYRAQIDTIYALSVAEEIFKVL